MESRREGRGAALGLGHGSATTATVSGHWAVTDDRVSRGGGRDPLSLTGDVKPLRRPGRKGMLFLVFPAATHALLL